MQQVLFVDDDPLFLAVVRSGVRRYSVVTESDPRRGLDLVTLRPFAFVVSDFQFDSSEIDGVALLTLVRARAPTLGRVLISASIVPRLDEHLAASVVEHFVSKPVAVDELERSLDGWWSSRG